MGAGWNTVQWFFDAYGRPAGVLDIGCTDLADRKMPLGQALTEEGIRYKALDIFEGFGVELFDLNRDDLSTENRNAYDLVCNFGTTEHVLNQWNAFKVIHDACAVDGIMWHNVPMAGYTDHGFFSYSPRLLVWLARANRYDILEMRLDGARQGHTAEVAAERYAAVKGFRVTGAPGWIKDSVPTVGVIMIARKRHDASFRAALELSTTVGSVATQVKELYG